MAVLTGEGPAAGCLMNEQIREFVITGGSQIGPGSVIVRIEGGSWIAEPVF